MHRRPVCFASLDDVRVGPWTIRNFGTAMRLVRGLDGGVDCILHR